MTFDPQVTRQAFEAKAIALSLVADEAGVRGTQDDINEVRELLEDLGHRPQHVLDPLVGGEQPEGQRDEAPFDSELHLVAVRLDESRIGDAVRDQVDLGLRDAVDLQEECACAFGHDDHPRGKVDQLVQDAPLIGVGLAQDRMQGRHDRHPQVPQEAEDMTARTPSEDPIFVLKADDVGIREVQEIGRAAIAVTVLLVDLEPNFGRVVVPFGTIVHRHDEAFRLVELAGHRVIHVVRECGDAALARQVVTDKCNLLDFRIANDWSLHDESNPGLLRVSASKLNRAITAWPTILSENVAGGVTTTAKPRRIAKSVLLPPGEGKAATLQSSRRETGLQGSLASVSFRLTCVRNSVILGRPPALVSS